ncbi:MAG: polyprenyl synthetase family protein [Bryobacteraceae bacterium]|nr:polyprenyl synthetase family protein [Bryobacteraceae bacterium]
MASVVTRPTLRPDLALDRLLIEHELRSVLPPAGASPVSACMEYAVMGEAQRLRPMLALRTGQLLNSEAALTLRAAAATELLHCASLIVDDLPCMDNDATRRNRPSAHVAYGESTALLAAFGLVALAARTVMEQNAPERYFPGQRRFLVSLLRTLDCTGLIGGQVMDLELSGDRREQCRDQLNDLKTVPLFLLAIEAGVAYAPGPVDTGLQSFGRHYGVALQMTDDYLDGEAQEMGPLEGQLAATKDCLAPYGAAARPLLELVEYLHARAQDYCHR